MNVTIDLIALLDVLATTALVVLTGYAVFKMAKLQRERQAIRKRWRSIPGFARKIGRASVFADVVNRHLEGTQDEVAFVLVYLDTMDGAQTAVWNKDGHQGGDLSGAEGQRTMHALTDLVRQAETSYPGLIAQLQPQLDVLRDDLETERANHIKRRL